LINLINGILWVWILDLTFGLWLFSGLDWLVFLAVGLSYDIGVVTDVKMHLNSPVLFRFRRYAANHRRLAEIDDVW
jgi:hypothetical protein